MLGDCPQSRPSKWQRVKRLPNPLEEYRISGFVLSHPVLPSWAIDRLKSQNRNNGLEDDIRSTF